ncbi:vacuolar import and degradation protein-domain-containing protein [Phyllosticta citribraziliensis]|uniref:Vacuolar import and degradation protein-domain-containing protein n=1 Tax=Phyllosticta citribraziliensis TaxID=989973 RepID=A0ABR1L8Y8_9PEZI
MPPPTSRASPQPTVRLPPTAPPAPLPNAAPLQDDSTARPNTPPSYLSALRQLESPVSPQVINLAATLTTQAENEADADNVSFLRRPMDPQDEWRQQNAAAEDELFEEVRAARDRLRARTVELHQHEQDTRDRQMRLSRVMERLERLNRLHFAMPYSDRVPHQNNLYDWSPPAETENQDDLRDMISNEGARNVRELRRHWERQQRNEGSRTSESRWSSSTAQPSESSLRSTQSRRPPRFSARSRDNMQRYITDRDTAFRGAQSGDLGRIQTSRYGWHSSIEPRPADPSARAWTPPGPSTVRDRAWDRDYRRAFLENPSSNPPPSSPWLEQTIRYLSKIRTSESYEDSLFHAVDAGFVTKEFFGDNHEDFILDVGSIPQPAETSWLAPGAVFSGSQHATTVTSSSTSSSQTPTTTATTLYRLHNNDNSLRSTSYGADPLGSHRTDDARPPHTQHQQDRWPVKVTIHAVDWAKMTLSATMEAYNVPSHPPQYPGNNLDAAIPPRPGTRTSSITTYLEGEILDFQTHTLLTESFKSSPATDATYWRKLPPFAHLRDNDLIHSLVSHEYVSKLANEWILMRWKERCFVKSTGAARRQQQQQQQQNPPPVYPSTARTSVDEEMAEDGCGLTISGFYYVCLRRSDGAVEGLYYDPQSSPYQHLKLSPVGGGNFPVWGFR